MQVRACFVSKLNDLFITARTEPVFDLTVW